MRIDANSSSYVIDHGARAGAAVTPFREVQRTDELRREQPTPGSASQGFERLAQDRQVEQGSFSSQAYQQLAEQRQQQLKDVYERPVTSKVAQALASYGSTAAMTANLDAHEVLGLDLFA